MSEITHDVIVIGAGQGGLSVSYHLTQAGISNVVLDRGGVAHAWEANRWDSFCLVTPNWTINLPGKPYEGSDPDGFMPRDEFVAYIKDWAKSFDAPVRSGVEVKHVRRADGVFVLGTSDGPMKARQVVVATATYQHPKIPPVAAQIPDGIAQLHAEAYKNPDQVADGAVMVVGSGQTGCQIVEDFLRAKREVYLCVARTGRLPRRYRGRDCLSWQKDMGLLDRTPDMLDSPGQRFVGDPHLTGRDGGATISLHNFHRRGVKLVGRLDSVSGTTAHFRDDLAGNLKFADEYADDFRTKIDAFIEVNGLSAPSPTQAELAGEPGAGQGPVESPSTVDLKEAKVSTIIWATGFMYDFSWIEGVEVDAFDYPTTQNGQSSVPGLYFCGLNWMTKRKSGILYGVEEDARAVTKQLIAQAGNTDQHWYSEV